MVDQDHQGQNRRRRSTGPSGSKRPGAQEKRADGQRHGGRQDRRTPRSIPNRSRRPRRGSRPEPRTASPVKPERGASEPFADPGKGLIAVPESGSDGSAGASRAVHGSQPSEWLSLDRVSRFDIATLRPVRVETSRRATTPRRQTVWATTTQAPARSIQGRGKQQSAQATGQSDQVNRPDRQRRRQASVDESMREVTPIGLKRTSTFADPDQDHRAVVS